MNRLEYVLHHNEAEKPNIFMAQVMSALFFVGNGQSLCRLLSSWLMCCAHIIALRFVRKLFSFLLELICTRAVCE